MSFYNSPPSCASERYAKKVKTRGPALLTRNHMERSFRWEPKREMRCCFIIVAQINIIVRNFCVY